MNIIKHMLGSLSKQGFFNFLKVDEWAEVYT